MRWGKEQGENLLHEIKIKKRKTATSVRELQTPFERQNVIPFGILGLGKQPGFILEFSWSVCVCACMFECVCLEEGCFVGDEGLSELGSERERERERWEHMEGG